MIQGKTAVANPAPTTAHLKSLQWQNQGGFLVASDETCLFMRETMGSRIAGFVFGTVFGLGGIGYGGWLLTQEPGGDAKAFGGLVLLVGLVFSIIVAASLRSGRWMIAYDRALGEIRYRKKTLPSVRVRCITTRPCGGGSMPNRIVTAELEDGTYETIGPSGVSTWPMHWAKQAADWMSLPHR